MVKIKWVYTDNKGFYKAEDAKYDLFRSMKEANDFISEHLRNEKNFFLLEMKPSEYSVYKEIYALGT